MRVYKLNLSTVVWGKTHCDLFLNYCLPSLMSENNLPAIKEKISCSIYATQEDFNYLKKNKAFTKFQESCKVLFINQSPDQHTGLRGALNSAYKNAEVLKLFAPDVVISDGSLKFAWDKIKEGFDAVIFPCGALRINMQGLPEKGISNKDLPEIFNNYMHTETARHFIDSKYFFEAPVQKLERNGAIKVSSYFYQCFMLDCLGYQYNYNHIEMDIVREEERKVYIASDSSEVFEISLSPPDPGEHNRRAYNEENIFRYMESLGYGPFNQRCYSHGFMIK